MTLFWNKSENAVAMAREIAERAIAIHHIDLVDEIYDVVVNHLRANCSPDTTNPNEYQARAEQFRNFGQRWDSRHPIYYVFKLVCDVARAWTSPDRGMKAIYMHGRLAGLNPANIDRTEMRHRLRDVDPDCIIDETLRLAFEAAWLSGSKRFAMKLLPIKPSPPQEIGRVESGWITKILGLKAGDPCEFQYPARKEWLPGTIIQNGTTGWWSVYDIQADREVEGLYIESIRCLGQTEAWSKCA